VKHHRSKHQNTKAHDRGLYSDVLTARHKFQVCAAFRIYCFIAT